MKIRQGVVIADDGILVTCGRGVLGGAGGEQQQAGKGKPPQGALERAGGQSYVGHEVFLVCRDDATNRKGGDLIVFYKGLS